MWFWILLFLTTGFVVLYYSRIQPFTEISGRFAVILMLIGITMWISSTAARPTAAAVAPTVAAAVGGIAVISGVIHMAVLRDDVVIAPFGGVLLCMGALSLMGERWPMMSQTEQIGSFILASVIVLLEIYLAFRGLVVGVQGITWSKSGLRQVNRGLLRGPRGAISHFERSWDMDDPWLNAMSHAALALIHRHLGDSASEKEHLAELESGGGWDSVDEAWVKAIEDGLSHLKATPRGGDD